MCLDHKVVIRATCTWLLKPRVRATLEAHKQLHIIHLNTCTACNHIIILIITLISLAKIRTKCQLASTLQVCIHLWFKINI
jgi:hypothetical protein